MMPPYETFVTKLLRAYHGKGGIYSSQLNLPGLDQIRHLCDVGLGPIAFHTYGEMINTTEPDTYSILHGADLTTRVIYKQMEDATIELLTSLQDVGVTPILLKGISTAHEFYAPSYLRLLGDVDIFVSDSETEITMATLTDLGYEIADRDWHKYHEKRHHHLPAARNPRTGVTLEVHTDLFEPGEPFAKEDPFRSDLLDLQRLEFDYRGVCAARFNPEFQLAYTIAHWSLDSNWAINLTSINDVVHILRRYESELNWSMLVDWIDTNPRLYANFATLFDYLEQTDIVAKSPQTREALAKVENQLQPRTSKTLLWLLHNYPFNAREKSRDDYAIWRAHTIWTDLTDPNSRDITIPVSVLRTMIRSIHHGKYNPIGWLLSFFRTLAHRFRTH